MNECVTALGWPEAFALVGCALAFVWFLKD